MEVLAVGVVFILVIVSYYLGKHNIDPVTFVRNDEDQRFINAAYDAGRSTQCMFIVTDIGTPYKSSAPHNDLAVAARQRLRDRRAKIEVNALSKRLNKDSWLDSYVDKCSFQKSEKKKSLVLQ